MIIYNEHKKKSNLTIKTETLKNINSSLLSENIVRYHNEDNFKDSFFSELELEFDAQKKQ